jgi:hypothetical protein
MTDSHAAHHSCHGPSETSANDTFHLLLTEQADEVPALICCHSERWSFAVAAVLAEVRYMEIAKALGSLAGQSARTRAVPMAAVRRPSTYSPADASAAQIRGLTGSPGTP